MDVILRGRFLTAEEALSARLAVRVVGEGEWLDEAKWIAAEIASKAPFATRLAKEGSCTGRLQQEGAAIIPAASATMTFVLDKMV